jgi:hypothetical protein
MAETQKQQELKTEGVVHFNYEPYKTLVWKQPRDKQWRYEGDVDKKVYLLGDKRQPEADKLFEEILARRLEDKNQHYIKNLCTQIPEPKSQAGPSKEPKKDISDDNDEDDKEESEGEAKSVTKDKDRSPDLSGQLGILTISGKNKERSERSSEKTISPQISNRQDSLFGPLTPSSERSPVSPGKPVGELPFAFPTTTYASVAKTN